MGIFMSLPKDVRRYYSNQYLHSFDVKLLLNAYGVPFTFNVEFTYFAAEHGYLQLLKYAHDNGCKWDEWTCAYAAEGGHLHVLIYAHDNGCRWNTLTREYAARGGHPHVLEWIKITVKCNGSKRKRRDE